MELEVSTIEPHTLQEMIRYPTIHTKPSNIGAIRHALLQLTLTKRRFSLSPSLSIYIYGHVYTCFMGLIKFKFIVDILLGFDTSFYTLPYVKEKINICTYLANFTIKTQHICIQATQVTYLKYFFKKTLRYFVDSHSALKKNVILNKVILNLLMSLT